MRSDFEKNMFGKKKRFVERAVVYLLFIGANSNVKNDQFLRLFVEKGWEKVPISPELVIEISIFPTYLPCNLPVKEILNIFSLKKYQLNQLNKLSFLLFHYIVIAKLVQPI